ncbi:hypothetical protein I302_107280 [Kwoniella bestiolae CBS 10118]|uniref:Uncharacterized protein n=1 Tax=Kwoniella bestiolae CBS 10118 TaxID=1296100 RepID=A0A1B9FZ00_9TREE|nr:hypothetical protein I302_06984 [Kwoniella bestiolae CBS 10118]OCF23998.1 hypothetical protein I302_06984 [Kwoniella bestiolae CBS 10118]
MSYTPDVHLQRGLEREFGHYLLEYEHLIMNKKIEPGQGLSRYMQRLLGEMSTVWDLKKMLGRLSHRFDREMRIQANSVEDRSILWPEEHNRLWIGLKTNQIIFKSPTTTTKVLDGAEKFTPELCKALWKEWDANSQEKYGMTLEEMFEIDDIFTPPKPRWTPTKIEGPSFEHPITEESRVQSSHGYLKTNELT